MWILGKLQKREPWRVMTLVLALGIGFVWLLDYAVGAENGGLVSTPTPTPTLTTDFATDFDEAINTQVDVGTLFVTWVSTSEEDGVVEYARNAPDLESKSGTFNTANDDRGEFADRLNKRTHRVSVGGLSGVTTVHYRVVSGGETTGPFQATLPTSVLTAPANRLTGAITYLAEGRTGVQCILSMRVRKEFTFFGQDVVEHSLWTNVLSNGGSYSMDITNIRNDPTNALNSDFNAAFAYDNSSTESFIEIVSRCDAGNLKIEEKTTQDTFTGTGFAFDVAVSAPPPTPIPTPTPVATPIITPVPTAIAVPTPTPGRACNGKTATITGTDAGDLLVGTDGHDVIVGKKGDDTIIGLGGNDTICGGPGRDTIHGGEGDDWISAGRGPDNVNGGAGRDVILAGPGRDLVIGGTEDDLIAGHGGSDQISGGRGSDSIMGHRGGDYLLGGEGDDMLVGGGGDDTIDCGPGDDIARGGPGTDAAGPDCELQTQAP